MNRSRSIRLMLIVIAWLVGVWGGVIYTASDETPQRVSAKEALTVRTLVGRQVTVFGRVTGTNVSNRSGHHFLNYGFSGVGCSLDKEYFADAQSGGRAHFRHHYFKLGLIAHFHRASLLNGRASFTRALSVLQRDFLMFRNM